MPFVNVKMLKGRTQDQKRDLARAITDALVEICGAPEDGTMVAIEEFDHDNWAKAGTLVSDQG